MNKQAPNLPRILVMVGFALSCFALILFLWLSFGGKVPLQPKGYRVQIPFRQGNNLVTQVDVRISGVNVGKVTALKGERDRTLAQVQIKPRYAPLPDDVRATLRQKTLLGEVYIELTPGSPTAPKLPEDAVLPAGRVQQAVELDQILQAFDPKTRTNLRSFLESWGKSVDGRAQDVSDTVGNLPVFSDSAAGVLGILDRQKTAVRRLIADGSTVFGVTAKRDQALRTIVRQGDQVLATTAARPQQVRATVRALPGVLNATRGLLAAQKGLARDLAPGARALLPAADQLRPTLVAAEQLSPQLPPLAASLRNVNAAAGKGFPAVSAVLRAARPALTRLDPLAGDLTPVIDFISLYRREVVSSFANVAAASESTAPALGGGTKHVVRILTPVGDTTIGGVSTKSPTDRTNAYPAPAPSRAAS